MIDHSPLPNLPFHLTEWNSFYSPNDFMPDSYQQSALILSKVNGAYRFVS